MKVLLYMHAGSGNHGCEAIINSTCHMLEGEEVSVISARAAEDRLYSLPPLCEILQERRITDHILPHAYYLAKKIVTRDPMCYIEYRYRDVLKDGGFDAAVSVGGDNYCYPEQVEDLMLMNRAFTARGIPTVLWGASVEPELLKRPDVTEDMKRYAHIFAREKLTYDALLKAGVEPGRLHLYPDPAFALETKRHTLPKGFAKNNTVGINVSPMAAGMERRPGIVMQNYRRLIRGILDSTDMNVALLPHVVWKSNDDRGPLAELYNFFEEHERIVMLPDCSCLELKGYISGLRYLVASRTHASIAAYSSQVPALVAGYSVKAEGIARELFGDSGHYVVPVQRLRTEDELWREFVYMTEHEEEYRRRLSEVIPGFVERALQGGECLRGVLRGAASEKSGD